MIVSMMIAVVAAQHFEEVIAVDLAVCPQIHHMLIFCKVILKVILKLGHCIDLRMRSYLRGI